MQLNYSFYLFSRLCWQFFYSLSHFILFFLSFSTFKSIAFLYTTQPPLPNINTTSSIPNILFRSHLIPSPPASHRIAAHYISKTSPTHPSIHHQPKRTIPSRILTNPLKEPQPTQNKVIQRCITYHYALHAYSNIHYAHETITHLVISSLIRYRKWKWKRRW